MAKKGKRRKKPEISRLDQGKGSTSAISEARPGRPCPECSIGTMEYDGCLNLTCERCGYVVGGVFT